MCVLSDARRDDPWRARALNNLAAAGRKFILQGGTHRNLAVVKEHDGGIRVVTSSRSSVAPTLARCRRPRPRPSSAGRLAESYRPRTARCRSA